jgi:hypothetical protein
MPALEIPPGFGQISHVLSLTGDPEPMVVTNAIGPDIADVADAQSACNLARGLFTANIMQNVYNAYSHVRTEMRYLLDTDAVGDPLRVVIDPTVVVGVSSQAPVPQNTACLVHKRTAVAGRQGRGRMYIPGLQESQVTETGAILSAYIPTLQADVDVYFNGFTDEVIGASTLSWYLLHSLPLGALVPPPPTRITTMQVDGRVATQRRRLRR